LVLSEYKIRDCFIPDFFVGKSRWGARFADKNTPSKARWNIQQFDSRFRYSASDGQAK
jgi:hypothetical protein